MSWLALETTVFLLVSVGVTASPENDTEDKNIPTKNTAAEIQVTFVKMRTFCSCFAITETTRPITPKAAEMSAITAMTAKKSFILLLLSPVNFTVFCQITAHTSMLQDRGGVFNIRKKYDCSTAGWHRLSRVTLISSHTLCRVTIAHFPTKARLPSRGKHFAMKCG